MRWILLPLGIAIVALGSLLFVHKRGDAEIRAYCRGLPPKISQAEVRSLAESAGLSVQLLPHSEMRVSKDVTAGLFPRALSCRIVFNRDLAAEFRILEGE